MVCVAKGLENLFILQMYIIEREIGFFHCSFSHIVLNNTHPFVIMADLIIKILQFLD